MCQWQPTWTLLLGSHRSSNNPTRYSAGSDMQFTSVFVCMCLPTPVCDSGILFGYASLLKKKKTPKLVAPNNNLLHYLTVLRINWANLRVLTWGLSGSYSQMEADVLQSFTWAGCPRWAFHSCVWHLSRDGWSSWALGRHLSLSLSLHVDSLSELPAA